MAKASKPLLDRIKHRAVELQKRPQNWFSRLPPDVQTEILAVKQAWHDGEIQSTVAGLARAIMEDCKDRGFATCGLCGMREWITRR